MPVSRSERVGRRRSHRARLALAALWASLGATGCGREFFRNWADQDVTEAVYEKSRDPRWRPDLFTIEPPALSRFASPYDPDRPPAPPDDYAAEALSPVPQWPVHRLLTPAEGTGYLDLLEQWRRQRPNERPVDVGVDSGPSATFGRPAVPPVEELAPFVPFPNSGPDAGELSPIPDGDADEAAPPDPRELDPAVPETPAPPEPREPVSPQPPTAQRSQDGHVLTAAFQVPEVPDPGPVRDEDPAPLPPGVEAGMPDVVVGESGDPPPAGGNLIEILKPEATVFDEGLAAGIPPEIDPYVIDPQQALTLALQNSRVYQFQLENVYLASLAATLQRFRLEPQFVAGIGPQTGTTAGGIPNSSPLTYNYRTREAPGGQNSLLSIGTVAGVGKLFSFGTTAVAGIANQTILQFAGPDAVTVQSNGFLPLQITQPFLRNGGRAVTLEALTQAERTLLYQVRTFAQFRREFFVSTLAGGGVTGGTDQALGYLNLLASQQAVENNTKNVAAFERVFEVFQQLGVGAGSSVRPLDIVTVEQSLQGQRLTLAQSLNAYRNNLDTYKIQLGMPPDVTVIPDTGLLVPFRRVFDEIDALAAKPRPTLNRLVAGLPPLEDVVVDGRPVIEPLKLAYQANARRQPIAERITERRRLLDQLARRRLDVESERRNLAIDPDPRAAADRLALLERQIRQATAELATIGGDEASDRAEVARLIQEERDYFALGERRLEEVLRASERVALENRVDLMNARAQLYDAWRQLAVTANQLQGVFTVSATNTILTPTSTTNPFAFDSSAKNFNLVLNAELPLVRLQERNNYVQAHINYERQRRTLMQSEDGIKNQVRVDVRDLQLQYTQYEINKLAYISALVAQDQALQSFLEPPRSGGAAAQGGTVVLNLVNQLASVLRAQNGLVQVWVAYQTRRLSFYRDLGTMPFDEWEAFYELFPSAGATPEGGVAGGGGAADPGPAGLAEAAAPAGVGGP